MGTFFNTISIIFLVISLILLNKSIDNCSDSIFKLEKEVAQLQQSK
jgi:hypothetical protein